MLNISNPTGGPSLRELLKWGLCGLAVGMLTACRVARSAPAKPPAKREKRQEKGQMELKKQEEIVENAKRFARDKGRKVELYKVEVSLKGEVARVEFRNDQGPPGDHFTVLVDPATAQVKDYIPGR